MSKILTKLKKEEFVKGISAGVWDWWSILKKMWYVWEINKRHFRYKSEHSIMVDKNDPKVWVGKI